MNEQALKYNKKDNVFVQMAKESLSLVKMVWLNRKGNEVHWKVYNTIQTIYENNELKPLIVNVYYPINACMHPKTIEVQRKIRELLSKKMPKKAFINLKKKLKGKWIFKKPKAEDQWEFIIHLPPTITYKKFKEHQEVFERETGGQVDISYNFGSVVMRVMTKPLGTNYPFVPINKDVTKYRVPITVGYTGGGILVVDLADVISILVSGLPKMGKSVWLHNLVINLLLSGNVDLNIIDLKRGVEFSYLKEYYSVAIDMEEAESLLEEIVVKMDKRYDEFVLKGVNNIEKYNAKGFKMDYLAVVIDEISELKTKTSFENLRDLIKRGRAAGILLIVATQKPSGAMHQGWTDTRDLFDARICFHVGGNVNFSQVALGAGDINGCNVPHIKGRGVFKYGRHTTFQGMIVDVYDECIEILKDVLMKKQSSMGKPVKDIALTKGEKHVNPKKMLPPR